MPFEEFQEKVKNATNGRISVVRESYRGIRYSVTAYCNIHKIYFNSKQARDLYRGRVNCPECIKELRKKRGQEMIKPWEDVLESFRQAYGDKFSYDETTYNGTKELMKVHCNDCGANFEISPEHHLKYNNGGCPNCHLTRVVKCKHCGKDMIVDRHIGVNEIVYCDDCKRKLRKGNIKRKQGITKCKICGRLLNSDMKCDNQFCNEHHILTFKTLIKYFGFDESKLGTEEAEAEFYRIRNMLYDMYWTQHLTSSQITKIFNYPDPAHLTNNVFLRLEIPVKTISQSLYDAYKNGTATKHNYSTKFYKACHHITWNKKDVYLRSSYELDYAKYLDENKIDYDVEKIRIEYYDTQQEKCRIAIPDFYLIEENTIVEIKSSWTIDVINMIDKVKAYKENGYNFKLILNHEETDLYSLLNEMSSETSSYGGQKHRVLKYKYKTVISNNKWRWMNNGSVNYKVVESEIEQWLKNGFVFGCLIKKK